MDNISKAHRSWNMGRIRSTNTAPELKVRSVLHRLGYRFRLHAKKLPGKPDIVLPKWKVAIFVHGCFWHRHKGCTLCYTPKSRADFWEAKFRGTVERDRVAVKKLKELGWRVSIVWECEISKDDELASRLQQAIEPERSHHASDL